MKFYRTAFFYDFLTLLVLFLVGAGLTGCVVVPPPIESHYNRGVDLYDQGKYAEAIEEYKLALRVDPEDNFSRYNLAVAYQDQGKLKEALALYKKIIEDIEDTKSRINLAIIYVEQGKEDLAFDQLHKAAEANPDSPDPPSIMGEYLERGNRWSKAEKNYLKAIQIEDKHAVSHFRLGRLYFKMGNLKEGEQHMKKAIDLEPEEPAYFEVIGTEYENQDRIFDAIGMLERVSVLQPDRVDIYIRLGDLYKRKQYYKNAVNRYWSALALNEQNPYVHKALKEVFEILIKEEEGKLESLKEKSEAGASTK